MENPDPIDDFDEIKRLVLAGEKIGAIQLYREKTGAGLAESKTAIEQLQTQLRGFKSADGSFPNSAPRALGESAAITEALFAGRKIQAIQLYREQNKVGLAEAKRAMDELEAKLRLSAPGLFSKPPRNSCLPALGVLAILGLGLWRLLH